MGVRIGKAAGADYYLSDRLAQERQYPAPAWARWDRAGGLSWVQPGAEVMAVEFRAAMAARPQGGAPLTTRRTRAAYDLTVDCEKSLSALWALAGDRERAAIEASHDSTVSAVITAIERLGFFTRRGAGGCKFESVAMPATARFLHLTSRPAPMPSGRLLPGPHVHSQILIMNLARRADGYWGTIDGRRLYRALGRLEAVRRQELDERLHDIGIGAHRDRAGCLHIQRIDPRIADAFSPRSTELRRATRHIADERAAAIARRRLAVLNRAPKSALSLAALQTAWHDEAEMAVADERASGQRVPAARRSQEDPIAELDRCGLQRIAMIEDAREPEGDGWPGEMAEEDPYLAEERGFADEPGDDPLEDDDLRDDGWMDDEFTSDEYDGR